MATLPAKIISTSGVGATGPANAAPLTQRLLFLHGAGQAYQVHTDAQVPRLAFGELLVEIFAIGLNPIDWKSAAFGFGLHQLPSINGREFVGRIIASEVEEECDLKPGEWVLAVSTDYRDYRKAAFQEFATVCCYNAIRIPRQVDSFRVASIGVAYVAASLALGACLGITFPKDRGHRQQFNLLDIANKHPEDIPDDIADEVFRGISPGSRPVPGEWVLVYGASSISAQLIIQLAKLGGLKVIGVANLEKHRRLLESLGTDLLIDRTDLDVAERDIQRLVPGSLRFAIDTVGSETALWCQNILASRAASRYSSPGGAEADSSPWADSTLDSAAGSRLSHLVALTGKPKAMCPNVKVHTVPIKLFHTSKLVGSYLSKWLYELLDKGTLQLPDVEFVDGGLDAINAALERLRAGNVSGKRLVVRVKEPGTDTGALAGN